MLMGLRRCPHRVFTEKILFTLKILLFVCSHGTYHAMICPVLSNSAQSVRLVLVACIFYL